MVGIGLPTPSWGRNRRMVDDLLKRRHDRERGVEDTPEGGTAVRNRIISPGLLTAGILMSLALEMTPVQAFCIRNDTGAPIRIDATNEGIEFGLELDNNKKACCDHKKKDCVLDNDKIDLSISSSAGEASCSVTVPASGNVNVTGQPDSLKCKAVKAGSTMDWASG